MFKPKFMALAGALVCILLYQNCYKVPQIPETSGGAHFNSEMQLLDMSVLDGQKMLLTRFVNSDGSEEIKSPFVYSTEIVRQDTLERKGPFLSFAGPPGDCNSNARLCSQDATGAYVCLAIESAMACTYTYDLSNYYTLPPQILLKAHSDPDQFIVQSLLDDSYAVFRILKPGEEVPIYPDPPLSGP